MNQDTYELVVRCIKFAAPVLANDVITALNATVALANAQIALQQKAHQAEEEKQKTTTNTENKE